MALLNAAHIAPAETFVRDHAGEVAVFASCMALSLVLVPRGTLWWALAAVVTIAAVRVPCRISAWRSARRAGLSVPAAVRAGLAARIQHAEESA
ncbi:MAG: hypothetical protein IPL94_00735 [Tetrasphaera sp.]|nr:hypothetical protein [Tetrasphaera sp.]